jgi:poly-beta-1,6-N-acetyl-D-glucosamine synthase
MSLKLADVNDAMSDKFLVITPARDEAAYIASMIESVLTQSVLPSLWIIVDDGSIDRTADIAEQATKSYSWIKVIRRTNRGYRDAAIGQVEAISDVLRQANIAEYNFIFNIDADVILSPQYFAKILQKFQENPQLGIAVGQIYDLVNGKLIKLRKQPYAMVGALKGWRRECFQQLGGLPRGEGWDGIDSMVAMKLGWDAVTFQDKELRVTHLRPCGSSLKSLYFRWLKHGRALHFAGAHPVWIIGSAFYHMLDRPYVLGGFCLIIGYLESMLARSPQYGNSEFRHFLRQWQMKTLAKMLKLTKCSGK